MADGLPPDLLAALDLVAFERQPDGRFRAAAPLPDWLRGHLAPDPEGCVTPAASSDFLAHFLAIAADTWDGPPGGRLMSGPFTEPGADGVERTLEATAIRAAPGAWLLLGLPLMRYTTTQRLLQSARDEALDVERTRRRHAEREILLHAIVHDLSNPLAGLRGSLRLLRADALPEDDRELLEIAHRQADRMRDLVRDVLRTFRREVDAMMPATAAPADAADALRQTAQLLGPRAQTAGVALAVDAPEPLPAVADARRLERALMNLAENAIRHSPEGGTVRLAGAVDGREVRLTVEDEGPGVPEGSREALFQRFASLGERRGQVGLGLYTVRLAVESWGGTVGYEDREGGGARFWIRLKRPRKRLA